MVSVHGHHVDRPDNVRESPRPLIADAGNRQEIFYMDRISFSTTVRYVPDTRTTAYQLVPSATVVRRRKDGNVWPEEVSVKVFKVLGAERTLLTAAELAAAGGKLWAWYDGDAGEAFLSAPGKAERIDITNGLITFSLDVEDIEVARLDVPVVADGEDGADAEAYQIRVTPRSYVCGLDGLVHTDAEGFAPPVARVYLRSGNGAVKELTAQTLPLTGHQLRCYAVDGSGTETRKSVTPGAAMTSLPETFADLVFRLTDAEGTVVDELWMDIRMPLSTIMGRFDGVQASISDHADRLSQVDTSLTQITGCVYLADIRAVETVLASSLPSGTTLENTRAVYDTNTESIVFCTSLQGPFYSNYAQGAKYASEPGVSADLTHPTGWVPYRNRLYSFLGRFYSYDGTTMTAMGEP